MKSQLLFVVVMFISSVLSQNYAQNFDILIGTTNDEVAIYLTENLQNNFIITGVKATSEPSARNAYIAEISPDGDLIQERTIVFPDSNSIISAVLQKENENYLCFGSIGSGIKDNVLLLELDHNFNIINKKKYAVQGGKRIDALDYLINSEGNIILYGTAIEGDISNPDFDLFLFETNNSFDSLQMDCQVNNETGIFNLVNSVIPKPNGGYYLQTINYDNQSRGQVLNLNRNFEILSYRAIPYEVAHGTLKWYSHNKFILTGKKTINKDNLPDDQIVSLIADTAFSQVYEELHMGAVDTSDIPGIETSVAYYDKNYIYIVGTHNYAYTEYPTHESYIYVARTDSLLNLKWEKFYGDGEAFYLTWAVTATNDNGCIIAATRYDNETQDNERDIYILKVDSLGNGPTVGINNPELKPADLIIYPNPGKNHLKVRTAVQSLGGIFNLYSMSGKQVLQQQITNRLTELNTQSLPQGVYIFEYTLNNKVHESGKWILRR